jgi:hypothetical protein
LASAESLRNRIVSLPGEIAEATKDLALAIVSMPQKRRGRPPGKRGRARRAGRPPGRPRKVGRPPKVKAAMPG